MLKWLRSIFLNWSKCSVIVVYSTNYPLSLKALAKLWHDSMFPLTRSPMNWIFSNLIRGSESLTSSGIRSFWIYSATSNNLRFYLRSSKNALLSSLTPSIPSRWTQLSSQSSIFLYSISSTRIVLCLVNITAPAPACVKYFLLNGCVVSMILMYKRWMSVCLNHNEVSMVDRNWRLLKSLKKSLMFDYASGFRIKMNLNLVSSLLFDIIN